MKIKFCFFLVSTLSLCLSGLNAQEEHEFLGFVILNDSTNISYRLIFTEDQGAINGYSITDLHGEHETKNVITGNYNKQKKEFVFKEEDIVYTKSPVTQQDFCFVDFSGKLKLTSRRSRLNGEFKGLFNDGTKCIDGEIKLVGTVALYKKMNRLNKKISRIKRIDDETKSRINPIKILDSIRMNTLKEGENTSVFWKSQKFRMEIWDAGKEDGDRISISVNGKEVLSNYTITHQKKILTFDLIKDRNEIVIRAENMGDIVPNTAKIALFDGEKELGLYTNLNKDKSTTVTIIKRN